MHPLTNRTGKTSSIGDVLSSNYQKPPEPPSPAPVQLPQPQDRCRFDLFVRYKDTIDRNKKTFCYRGDFCFNCNTSNCKCVIDPNKILWNCVKNFANNYKQFKLADLCDHTKPKSDPGHVILKYREGIIVENRLSEYAAMLQEFPVPDYLK